MTAIYLWYLYIPYYAPESWVWLLLTGSAVYGIAIGCYMSVDYAL